MNLDTEIKPSFSIKYIILTIVIAGIMSIVGFLLKPIFDTQKREINISKINQHNLVDSDNQMNSQIDIKYSLKNNPNISIKSYFAQTIILKNAGTEGVENLEVIFSVSDTNIHFIKDPLISTIPDNIKDGMRITKISDSLDTKKHIWKVNLLNESEALIFDYRAYSTKKVDSFDFNVLARKKDWIISYKEITDPVKDDESVILDIVIPLSLIFFFILVFAPIYYKEWVTNPEIKKKYNSFLKFYWDDPIPWFNFLRKITRK